MTGLNRLFFADGIKHAVARRIIVELACGSSKYYLHRDVAAEYFDFKAAASPDERVPLEPLTPVEPKLAFDDLLPVYRRLKAEQGGFSAVKIFDLMKALGQPKEVLHRLLLDEAKAGRVTIHPTTSVELPAEVIDAGIRLPGYAEPFVTFVVKNESMTPSYANMQVNPFEDDVVREPREVSFSVKGLNDAPLNDLLSKLSALDAGALPSSQPAKASKAQLIVSPDRGYGKSHLLGRLFMKLGRRATKVYLRPFQDPHKAWHSILLITIQELDRRDDEKRERAQPAQALAVGTLGPRGRGFR